jgi:hypothetical protein
VAEEPGCRIPCALVAAEDRIGSGALRARSTIVGMQGEDWIVPQQEEVLRSRALDDIPELLLADKVSHAVADLVQATPVDARPRERAPGEFQHQALWLMAVIGLRALRAAMNVIAVGYEDQAAGYQRLIDELWNRAQKVRFDKSGNYAQQWCEGKPPGKAAKLTEQGLWEFWSRTQHADPAAVLNWVAITQEDGSATVLLGPERRPELVRGALTVMLSEVRDLGAMLAAQVSTAVPDLDSLTDEIVAAHRLHGLAD